MNFVVRMFNGETRNNMGNKRRVKRVCNRIERGKEKPRRDISKWSDLKENIQYMYKEEFEKSLGNMQTMYNNFPIIKDINPDDLNELIERDLYEYAKLKPNSLIKEVTEEILQFFKQKNIL